MNLFNENLLCDRSLFVVENEADIESAWPDYISLKPIMLLNICKETEAKKQDFDSAH